MIVNTQFYKKYICRGGYRIRSTTVCMVHYTPLGRFSKVDCSTTKRVPIPNDTSSESSRRDAFNTDLSAPTLSQLLSVEISTIKNRPTEGCDIPGIYTVIYTCIYVRLCECNVRVTRYCCTLEIQKSFTQVLIVYVEYAFYNQNGPYIPILVGRCIYQREGVQRV